MSDFEDEEKVHPCIICGRVATRWGVYTGRSRFDRIPLLSWVRKLQAMPWGYAVKERAIGRKLYCETHRQEAETLLEEAHAELRAAHAAFNAEQQQKILALDHGGLDQRLRANFERILDKLGLLEKPSAASQPKQLEAAQQSNVHVMPVASTGGE
jgi:hypothetical protein